MTHQISPESSSTHNADIRAPANEIIMYSTNWCFDCRRAKRVFASTGVPYHEIDIARSPEAAARVRQVNGGYESVPTIVFPDGSVLVEPSTRQLEAKLRQYQGELS